MKIVKFAAAALAGFCLWACGFNMLPSKDSWYARHFFIMQNFEQDTYKSLTDNGRLEFQKLFWASRSAEVKDEFDKRMAYIEKTFKTENSAQPFNTDRARVFLLNGPPGGVESVQNGAWGMAFGSGGAGTTNTGVAGINDRTDEDIQANTLELWSYPFEQWIVQYAFTYVQPNRWKQVVTAAADGRYVQGLEKRNRAQMWAVEDETTYREKLSALKAIK